MARRVLLNMLLKKLADKSQFPITGKLKVRFPEVVIR